MYQLREHGMRTLAGVVALAVLAACDGFSNPAREPEKVTTAFTEYEECINREAARLGQMGSLVPIQAFAVARICRHLLPSGNAGASGEAECGNMSRMSHELPPC
jgi:hypothetical protein